MALDDLTGLQNCILTHDWRESIRIAKVLKEAGVTDPLVDLGLAVDFTWKLQYSEALKLAERVIERDPANRIAAGVRASTLHGMGHTKLALDLVSRDDLSARESLLLKGRIAFESGDYRSATLEAERCLLEDPSIGEAYSLLYSAQWMINGRSEARQELERLFYIEGSKPAGLGLFHGYAIRGDLESAHHMLDDCINLDPEDSWLRLRLVEILDEIGAYHQALEAFDRMPPEIRELPTAQFCRAQTLARLGRLREAEQICWPLFKHAPDDMRYLRVLTWLLRKRHRWHSLIYAITLNFWGGRSLDKISAKTRL